MVITLEECASARLAQSGDTNSGDVVLQLVTAGVLASCS
jgi:hypothetical protein